MLRLSQNKTQGPVKSKQLLLPVYDDVTGHFSMETATVC